MKTKFSITILMIISFLSSCTNKSNNNINKASINNQSNTTIFFGGDIITMEGDKPNYIEVVVCKNDKIIFIGKKEEAIKKYPNFKKNDLKGNTMLPGFI